MELNEQNYHSVEMRKKFMGYSQFKDFEKCEVMALAKVNGEYEPEKTDALLVGSYVDAYFSGTLDAFIEENKDSIYSPKTGKMYAAFDKALKVIEFIENYTNANGVKILLKYLQGEHQKIMTGEIAGVPFKIKMDSYFPGKCIVDQKVMKDLEDVWVDKGGKNVKLNYIQAYDYPLEGAIYQEIERQNMQGKKLPFVLDVVTKEDNTNAELIRIDQDILEDALARVIEKAPRYQRIKMGEEEPVGCGKCPVCIAKKNITGPQSYRKLYLIDEEE